MEAGILVGIVSGVVYYLTLFPSVPGGDSGELMAESCLLGVAHPPGYPTYTLLTAGAMRLLPQSLGPPARRANLANAALGAAAAAFVAAAAQRLSRRVTAGRCTRLVPLGAGVLAGLSFALSPIVWTYAVGGEVFALNNALVAALLLLTVAVDDALASGSGWLRYAAAGAGVSGLALTNQHTSVVFIGPLAAWVVYAAAKRGVLRPVPHLSLLGLVSVASLAPYLYLPWASARATPGSWGDLTTVSGFLRHLLRKEYGSLQLSPMKADGSSVLGPFVQRLRVSLAHQLAWLLGDAVALRVVAAVLAVLGAVAMSGALAALRARQAKSVAKGGKSNGKGKGKGGKRAGGGAVLAQAAGGGGLRHRKIAARSAQDARGGGSAATARDEQQHGAVAEPPPFAGSGAGCAMVAAWGIYMVVFHYLANLPTDSAMPLGVLARFWMQPMTVASIMLGVGTAAACAHGSALLRRLEGRVGALLPVLGTLALLGWTAGVLAARWEECNHAAPDPNATANVTGGGASVSEWSRAVLAALPEDSLLLSHTDMNWNGVRYLQACEGARPDVVHLSTQLMPYPWFARQHHRYEGVTFPPVPKDASTEVTSAAHRRALAAFFEANEAAWAGRMFVDMHGVADSHLERGNVLAGTRWMVLPHGPVYRVLREPDESRGGSWAAVAAWAPRAPSPLLELGKRVSPPSAARYPPGTWEHGVAAMFHDAHYQCALLLLSHALMPATDAALQESELQTAAALQESELQTAAGLLVRVLDAADAGTPVSFAMHDVRKNAALAVVQLHRALNGKGEAGKVEAAGLHPVMARVLRGYVDNALPGDADADRFRPVAEALEKAAAQAARP